MHGPGVRVFYGWDRVPARASVAGGTAKLQKLTERWPNRPTDFSLLYLGTTYLPRDLPAAALARAETRARIVVNQDGVAYPGWAGERTDELNAPLRRAVLAADHVVYQSAFSKRSSDEFLGQPRGSWEILPNAVDVERFTPGSPPLDGPVVLLGGDQTQDYGSSSPSRRSVASSTSTRPRAPRQRSARLRSGSGSWRLGLGDAVDFLGGYTQADAPDVFRRAHVLLHTKVNDPCPTHGDRGDGLRRPGGVRRERRDCGARR